MKIPQAKLTTSEIINARVSLTHPQDTAITTRKQPNLSDEEIQQVGKIVSRSCSCAVGVSTYRETVAA